MTIRLLAGDLVLDPFAGAGTTLLVADWLRRDALGIDLSPDYTIMARERIGLFAELEQRTPPAPEPDEHHPALI